MGRTLTFINRSAGIALRIVKGMAITGVLLALLLANPFVQTYLAGKATEWLRIHKNIPLNIDKLQIIFPNQIGLRNMVLYDDHGDTIIYVNQFRASLANISDRFTSISLSKVYFDSTHYYLITPKSDSINGFMRFLEKLQSDKQSDDASNFRLRIGDIHFEKLRFRRRDVNNPNLPEFNVYNAHLRLRKFSLSPDSISAVISRAYATDDLYFRIYQLQARLTYANDHIGVYNLTCTTDSSRLDLDGALRYESPDGFNDFENAVQMDVNFRHTSINTSEIRSLLSEFPAIPDIRINGRITGTLNDFTIDVSPLDIGRYTFFQGKVSLSRIIDQPRNPVIDAEIQTLKTRLDESVQVIETLAGDMIPDFLQKEIFLSVAGQFKGTPLQFGTALQFDFENDESIVLDLTMAHISNQPEYVGSVNIKNVNIGRILGVENIGKSTANFSVSGKGFEPEKINLTAQGSIKKIFFNKYTYQNILLSDFVFRYNNYSGQIQINDPNLSANSVIHYKHGENSKFTEFKLKLNRSNPYALRWTNDSITHLSLTTSGLIDLRQSANPEGNIVIKDISAENSLGNYYFESIKLLSHNTPSESQFELESDFASMKIYGNFNLFEIPENISDWLNKRLGKIPYRNHPYTHRTYHLNLQIDNVDALLELLYLGDLNIEPKTNLTATYNGEKSEISFLLKSHGIKYKSIHTGEMTTSWGHFSDDAAEGIVRAYDFKYEDLVFDTVQFQLVNTPDSNAFELLWTLTDSIGSVGHIDGWLVRNVNNQYRLHFDQSNFNIGTESFIINPDNYLEFEPERIYVSNFLMQNGPRSLLINGVISRNSYEILRLSLDNFRIDLFNLFLKPMNLNLDGVMQGEIIANDLLNDPKFASDFEIDSLRINGHYQGDLYFSSDWNVETNKMKISSYILRGQLKTLEISGTVITSGTPEVDLNFTSNRFRVNALAPLMGEFVENLRGTLNGEVSAKGQLSSLDIQGRLNFPNLGLTIPLLGTDYNFEGAPSVTISNREISFSEMIIRDTKSSSKATLNGKIIHRNFSDFRFSIGIDAERFLALNTNASSGDLYYGTAYVTGKISVTGPTDEPVIDVNVRTEKGTLFALPLNNPTEVGRKSFINFVVPDQGKTKESKSLNIGGLTLRFTIDVTPEAEAQLILDDRYNDMMRANGQGRISLTVPPSGDIKLIGNYQITKGVYNFNFQGLVSRKFIIEPGSTIIFTGDPLAASLDITTRYTTRTTLRGLLTDERYLNTRTQVDLILKITGVMFQPEISFDIKVPRAAPMVQTEINNALADKDKLTRQAFSLLLLNSFMADDFAVGTTTSGSTLVYDAFVSQISNLLAQRIKGVDIRLGYSQTNLQGQEGSINQQQDLELGISTTLFNDRIVINTNFDLSSQQNAGSTRRNDFAGDVELEYLITSDGKFRAKAFNRSLQNRIGLEQVGDYAQGVGLTYRTNFDSWYHDILRRRRKRQTENFHFEEPDTSSSDSSLFLNPKNPDEWKSLNTQY